MGTRVVAVDIGSVRPPSKFAWAAFDAPGRELIKAGEDPETAVSMLTPGLMAGAQAALLLEAPMAVPVPGSKPDAWLGLGKARDGEGNRPWSAGAGAGALATGLAQGAWMLRQFAVTVAELTATTQPGSWRRGDAQLLLAEAFITAAGKPGPACRRRRSGWTRAGGAPGQPGDADLDRVLLTTAVVQPAYGDGAMAGLQIDPGELCAEVLVVAARPQPKP
jgi:hypothetical protein